MLKVSHNICNNSKRFLLIALSSSLTITLSKKSNIAFFDSAKLIKDKHNLDIEVIDLQTIKPLDKNLIIESVKKTNRLIIVEESWSFASVGSEIVSLVQKDAFDYLDAPINKINRNVLCIFNKVTFILYCIIIQPGYPGSQTL